MSLSVVETYNTASGTFYTSVPAGATSVFFQCYGGGGGGARKQTAGYGGGGAGGCYAQKTLTPPPYGIGSEVTITVGSGGNTSAGGGFSSVKFTLSGTSSCSASGGNAPAVDSGLATAGSTSGCIGDIFYAGGGGSQGGAAQGGGGGGGEGASTSGVGNTATTVAGGTGSSGGDGGDGRNTAAGEGPGNSAGVYGGGGGGAYSTGNIFGGGTGGRGQVIITWTITNGVLSPISEFF